MNGEQEGWVTDPMTLKQQAGHSLEARCEWIRQRFPECVLSVKTLWRVYRRQGVRWKEMRTGYRHSEGQKQAFREKRIQAFRALHERVRAGQRILYADEVAFVPYSVRAKSWARTGENQVLRKGGSRLRPLYALVCVTPETGLLSYVLSEAPIRKPDALTLFEALADREPLTNSALFWDNLPMHRSREVVAGASEHDLTLTYNAPYSSKYHCIELAFAQVKREYRRGLIQHDFALTQ